VEVTQQPAVCGGRARGAESGSHGHGDTPGTATQPQQTPPVSDDDDDDNDD
jgi:hypothetical protein